MSSHARLLNLNRKCSSRNFDNDEYIYIPSENERTEEEYEEQEELKCSNTEILQLPSKLQYFNKKKSTKKEQEEAYNKDEKNKSDIIIAISSILESEIPKGECVISYNDDSTTSNLISYFARIHKVYKLNEKKIDNKKSSNQLDIQDAIKNQQLKKEEEYEESRQLL
ncbi:13639_t:CDS:2, partial [Funneliformis caledonium]